MTAEKAKDSSPTHFMEFVAVPCSGFVPCQLRYARILWPRIPFLVLFQVGTGWRRTLCNIWVAEKGASFTVKAGVGTAVGLYVTLVIWPRGSVAHSTPSRLPTFISQSPRPGVCAFYGQGCQLLLGPPTLLRLEVGTDKLCSRFSSEL